MVPGNAAQRWLPYCRKQRAKGHRMQQVKNPNQFLKTAGWKQSILGRWTPPWFKHDMLSVFWGTYSQAEALVIQAETNYAATWQAR